MVNQHQFAGFTDIPCSDLTAPEKHPAFEYKGFFPGKTIKLPRGHVAKDGHGAFPVDTALDMDVEVKMRDGISIYANVFRPDYNDAPKTPALICWSPYGKGSLGAESQNYDRMGPFRLGAL